MPVEHIRVGAAMISWKYGGVKVKPDLAPDYEVLLSNEYQIISFTTGGIKIEEVWKKDKTGQDIIFTKLGKEIKGWKTDVWLHLRIVLPPYFDTEKQETREYHSVKIIQIKHTLPSEVEPETWTYYLHTDFEPDVID